MGGRNRGVQQAVAPITRAVGAGGNRVGNGQDAGDHGDNHKHVEEVIRSNNDHPGFHVIPGRLEQPVNRR